jgi:hypothetical protein
VTNLFSLTLFAFVLCHCGQGNNPSSTNMVASTGTTKIAVGKSPGSVEIADFNNDTFPDLVVTSESDSSATILLNDGKGGFAPSANSPFFAGPSPNDICIADFNKDGHPDLAIANHDKKYITVLLGDGKGNFKQATHSPFATEGIPHVHGIASGDFNNDGWPDLVTESWGNDQVEVLFGDSTISFGKQHKFFKVGKRPYQRLRVDDLNGDHITDIVTTNTEDNNVTILLADGKGGFNEAVGSPFACGDNPFNMAIGDVNADGKPDLAIINSPSSMAEGKGKNGLTVLLNDGQGKFTMLRGSPFPAGQNPNRVAIGDVNGDGINDIVSSDFDGNNIFLVLMDKTKEVTSQVIATGQHPKGVAIARLNSDNKAEIVICNNADNSLTIIWGK